MRLCGVDLRLFDANGNRRDRTPPRAAVVPLVPEPTTAQLVAAIQLNVFLNTTFFPAGLTRNVRIAVEHATEIGVPALMLLLHVSKSAAQLLLPYLSGAITSVVDVEVAVAEVPPVSAALRIQHVLTSGLLQSPTIYAAVNQLGLLESYQEVERTLRVKLVNDDEYVMRGWCGAGYVCVSRTYVNRLPASHYLAALVTLVCHEATHLAIGRSDGNLNLSTPFAGDFTRRVAAVTPNLESGWAVEVALYGSPPDFLARHLTADYCAEVVRLLRAEVPQRLPPAPDLCEKVANLPFTCDADIRVEFG